MLTATDRTTAKTITTAAAAYCSEADEEWGIWRAECQSLNVAVEAASKDSRALNANLHIVWHISSFWVGRVMFGFIHQIPVSRIPRPEDWIESESVLERATWTSPSIKTSYTWKASSSIATSASSSSASGSSRPAPKNELLLTPRLLAPATPLFLPTTSDRLVPTPLISPLHLKRDPIRPVAPEQALSPPCPWSRPSSAP